MAFEFKLPDIGEGTAEGEIVKWLVSVGDQVQEDQPLVEVMTDKATVEIPSPRTGKILELGADEGEVVEVGEMLVVFGEGDEEPAQAEEEAVEAGEEPAEAGEEPAEAGEEPAEAGEAGAGEARVSDEEIEEARSRARAERQAAETAEAEEAGSDRRPWEAPPAPEGRLLATPATRRLARELEVDLSRVPGSGVDGRVMKEDVRAYVEGAPEGEAAPAAAKPERPAATPAAPAPAEEERVPLRGLRRRIAERMVQSKSTIPHFTYVEEVDMTEVVELRQDAKEIAAEKGIKLTYLPFIIKALIPALREHPYLNSSLDEEAEEIVLKGSYNIGIATATDRGLIVPVIKDADRKGVLELAGEIERLATAAREGEIGLEDLQGGTFTITSTGNIGGVIATPIINPPEVAILGVTRIRKRPAVVDDEIAIRQMLYLSLSVDHRVVDGAVAAEFMADLIRYLEDPKLLLLETL